MTRRSTKDDYDWPEVMYINGYAVFMGYLMMGVRGLGILIIAWSTVVLLGGFGSALGKKDFWCLTGITLVQTARVFNVILEETMRDFARSWWGLLGSAIITVMGTFERSNSRFLLALFLSGIQALVYIIILCPVAVFYMFGMYISAGVGLWRLIENDFSNTDGATNLKPALEVLYSLAVAQGLIFGYKKIHAFGAKVRFAECVALELNSVDKILVSAYFEETVAGCDKDPSFATGTNLVTYAVDLLMHAKSKEGLITGVKILGVDFVGGISQHGCKVLAKHLLTRPSSFGQTIHRLVEMLGPRSPYSTKIREPAARIIAMVASSVNLEEHPGWIHCISSVLETFEEYSWRPEEYERDSDLPEEYERVWLLDEYEQRYLLLHGERTESTLDNTTSEPTVDNATSEEVTSNNLLLCEDYGRMMRQGFNILQKLAVRQDNCKVIINTEGLLLKIMAPLNSMLLLRHHHDVWATIAKESLKVMMQLAVIPGETGSKLRGEISGSSKAIITTLEIILECLECDMALKISTVEILLHLSVDSSSMKACGSSGRIFTWILLLILLSPEISSDTRRLAGENFCLKQGLPLQQSVGFVIGDLTTALVGAGDTSTRLHAAKILYHLCDWCKEDDGYLKELKKAMVDIMPQVLQDIICCQSTKTTATNAVNNVQSSSQGIDLEMGSVSEGQGREQTSPSQHETCNINVIEDIKLQEELVTLCMRIRYTWYRIDQDTTRQLDEIAGRVCLKQAKPVKTFAELLKEAVELLKNAAAKEG